MTLQHIVNQFMLVHLRALIGPHMLCHRQRRQRDATCLGN